MRDIEMRFSRRETLVIGGVLALEADYLERQAAADDRAGRDTEAKLKQERATECRAIADRFVKVVFSLMNPDNPGV
jgi:propanediol dehydratase small subunit